MIEKIQQFVDLIISILTAILLLITVFEKVDKKKKPRNRENPKNKR